MTVDRAAFTKKIPERIRQDSTYNRDGFSLLTVGKLGEPALLRTMDVNDVISAIEYLPWERFFVHCRAATQGTVLLENTHAWEAAGVFYMHNGILRDRLADYYNVDSQLIGHKIETVGMDATMEWLKSEPFANVFFINPSLSWYQVYRSTTGSLFTDGKGNYSSNRVGAIKQYVKTNAFFSFDLPKPPKSKPRYRLPMASNAGFGTAATLADLEGGDDDDLLSEADWPNRVPGISIYD
jgi:hypothetical protein